VSSARDRSDRLFEDFHVGEKREQAGFVGKVTGEGGDLGAEGGGASGEFCAVGVGEGQAEGGDFFGAGWRRRGRGLGTGSGEGQGEREE